MDANELTGKDIRAIECYFNYWREFIQPIEDKRRVVQFERILNRVAAELYGPRVAFELSVRFLLEDRSAARSVRDE